MVSIITQIRSWFGGGAQAVADLAGSLRNFMFQARSMGISPSTIARRHLCPEMPPGDGRGCTANGQGALTATLLLLLTLFLPVAARALVITNTATVTSNGGGIETSSTMVLADIRTPSTVEFLQHAPGAPGAAPVPAATSAYSNDGTSSGTFISTGPINDLNNATIPLPTTVELLPATSYHGGEPIFIRLTDLDQNLDPLLLETVLVYLTSQGTGDSVLLRLTETGPNTGVFVGSIQSSSGTVVVNDRLLTVGINEHLVVSYADIADAGDTDVAELMVDPYGLVFRTSDGAPVSGAAVTLWDVGNNRLAEVFNDDGSPGFPATIISGDPAHRLPPGAYRFPFVRPGNYRLQVVPPTGYVAPSIVPTAVIQALPGNPFALVNGSRGEGFTINPGPAIHLDLPVDLQSGSLFISKTALKEQVAVGEFIQYSVTVTNNGGRSLAEVTVHDRLPVGFRYEADSALLDGDKLAEPLITADGRSLTFILGDLAASASRELRYVAGVSVGARAGIAVNSAIAGAGSITSNSAQAQVRVVDDLFTTRSLVVGRVLLGNCPNDAGIGQENPGLDKVRLVMEDGRYVETDPKGLYHFEGLEPGSHVLQVDLDSLPPDVEIFQCEENSRFAGVAHSTFVDLQPGTMWRADFYARSKQPAKQRELGIKLTSTRRGETLEIDLKVELSGGWMTMHKRRLYVTLPPELRYLPGTSRLDGHPITDPESTREGLIFTLADRTPAPWQEEVTLQAEIIDNYERREYTSKAFLRYERPPGEVVLAPQPSAEAAATTTPGSPEETLTASPQPTSPGTGASTPPPQADGILSLQEGQRLATAIQSISVRFDSRLKPELKVDGILVEDGRIGMQVKEKESGRSVAGYIGVDLGKPGPHTISFRGIDPFGNARFKQVINYIRTSEIATIKVLDTSGNLADGKSPVRVKLELRDQAGELITGEAILSVRGGNLSPLRPTADQLPEMRKNNTVTVDGQGYATFAPVSNSGSHTTTLAYGEITAEIRTYVKPQYREWIMVGLAEGSVGYANLVGNLENLEAADQEEGYYQDGRLAFYAKGKIKGKYLLTAAYDSARERDNLDNGLFGAIDPNKYYTLYGDKAQVLFDAASKDKLYLKLDGDQFYALYGDYDTGLTVTELSRYSRTLTGFKGEFYGEKLTATGFAAQTDHAFLKDELPGDGTSGLYRLSHSEIILNSEKITIETRDRFHSEVVLNKRQLSRFLDYTFDAQDGTIYFREPIYSRDAEFNPVYIVAEYEVASGAARDLTGGVRVAYQLDEKGTEVGLSLIHEGTPGARADLQGVDVKYAIDDKTTIKAEAAATSKRSGSRDLSGSAFLAEVSRHDQQLESKAYIRQQDGEFGLGQQAGSETGTRKYGADGRYTLAKEAALSGEIFRQETLGAASLRDSASALLTYKLDKLATSGGLRWARDEDGAGSVRTSTLLTGSLKRTFLADRLDLYVNGELAVAKDESSDYPNRLILGGEYALTTATKIFAAHEMTFGDQQDSQTSRVGLKATPWTEAAFHSSFEDQTSEAGVRTFASTGLTQGWKLNDNLRLDFGLERSQTLRHPGDTPQNVNVPPASGAITDDFTAGSVGATYKEKLWSMTGRGEYRDGEQEDKAGLLLGFYREESPGFGLSSVFRYFDSDRVSGTQNTKSELEFSVARRPLDSQWIFLDKAKFSEQLDRGPALSSRTRKLVNNLNANYLHNRRNQVSINHGIKYVIDNFDGAEYDGITQLLAVEYRHDLNKEWDLGVQSAARVTNVGSNALYSGGVSVGHSFAKNVWLSLGYNFSGFRDDDFSAADYTAQGVYVKCRAKFDQNTARQLLAWWEK